MKKKLSYFFCLLIFVISACQKNNAGQKESGTADLILKTFSATALTISQNQNQTQPKTDISPNIIYRTPNAGGTGFQALPSGYNDNIESFGIPKGYMVTFAENSDGTGESICYVAATTGLWKNLPIRLKNKISFVRYIAITNPKKKGAAQTDSGDYSGLGTDWFYNWGNSKNSTSTQEYVPMTWGKGSANATTALDLINKNSISHLLSFNEPDNANQSNITNIDTAVARYKIMQQTGLRLGSPVTEQDNSIIATDWLPLFMTKAQTEKARIDFIAIHWYDWGSQTKVGATDNDTAEEILTRFKRYLGKIHTAYPSYPIWITEFNANVNRTSSNVHILFMQKAAAWLNSISYVERYSYFFPGPLPPSSGSPNFTLTPIGQAWKNISSTPSFIANVVPN